MKHWLTAIAKCWFTIAALALTGTVYAQTYTITSLTNNNNNDGYFQFVNNGDVVWSGYNGTNWDLYKYDATSNTTTQMTNTTGADEYATGLNSRNDILWTQVNVLPTSTSTDLILLDGTTQTTTKLNATPICASSPNLLNDNGDVIWMESDTPPQTITTCDVYYYQASTHTTMNVSNNTLGDNFPNFYPGGNIIWTHDTGPIGSGAPTHVLLYNVANATVTDMTASYGVNGMQSWNAHGDIVWSGNDPSGTDTVIYRYDATSRTVAQITPVDGLTDAYPVAGPTGDVIWAKGTDLYYYYAATGVTMYVARGPWVGSGNFMANGDVIFLSTDATNTYNEVYVYKVATGQLVDISNTPTNVKWWYWFNTNGDITWRMGGSGADPAGGDIFVYQAATGTVDRLTNDTLEDNVPVINDKGEVVWIHFDGNDYEINKAVPQSAIPTVTLSASPTSVASGGSSTLTWSSTDATSCTASGGWTGAKDISGTLAVTVSATTIYTLACTGTGGTTTQSVTVTVVPAPTLTFTATPASIAPGGNSSLSWSTTNADSRDFTPHKGGRHHRLSDVERSWHRNKSGVRGRSSTFFTF